MNGRSMTDRIDVKSLLVGSFTTTQAPTNGIDVSDAHEAELIVNVGTVANIANSPQPTWVFKMQESDTLGSGYTDVAASDIILPDGASPSDAVVANVNAAGKVSTVYRAGYVGKKKYINVLATAANTPGASQISVTVHKTKKLVV